MSRSWRLLIGIALGLLPQLMLAQIVPNVSMPPPNPCPLAFLGFGCPAESTAGAAGIGAYIDNHLVIDMLFGFGGIAFGFFFYYSIRLLLESGDDSTIGEIKQAYGYAITGCIVVAISGIIAASVGTTSSSILIDTEAVENAILAPLITALKLLVGISLVMLIVVQGIRLIVLQGQDSELEKQKQKFFHGIIGVAIVLTANTLVYAVTPGADFAGSGTPGLISEQIGGIVSFLLELFAALLLLALLAAGAMLVFSVNDGLKDRAKKAIFTSIVALIIVFLSWVIVNFFIGLGV